jgi:hypothetical protein
MNMSFWDNWGVGGVPGVSWDLDPWAMRDPFEFLSSSTLGLGAPSNAGSFTASQTSASIKYGNGESDNFSFKPRSLYDLSIIQATLAELSSHPSQPSLPLIEDVPNQGLLGQGGKVIGAVGAAFNDASVGITLGISYTETPPLVPASPTAGISVGWDSNTGPTASARVGFSRQAGLGNVTGVLRLPFTAGSPTPTVSIPLFSPFVSVVGAPCGLLGVQIGPSWGGTSIGVIGYANLGCK